MASMNGPSSSGGGGPSPTIPHQQQHHHHHHPQQPTINISIGAPGTGPGSGQASSGPGGSGVGGAHSQQQQQQHQSNSQQQPQAPNAIMTRKCLQDLVKQVDPNEQLDDDVEDLLLGYAEEFFEQIVEGACKIAAHRRGSTMEVKDLQTYLERNAGIWVPGFGSEESKGYKRPPVADAHKQRMALIKKQLKKY